MKTQFLLEADDVSDLLQGKPFHLEVGNGVVIILQVEKPFEWKSAARVELKKLNGKKAEKRAKKRRRNATPGEQKKILHYAESNGVSKAAAHFKVRQGLITAWRRGGK